MSIGVKVRLEILKRDRFTCSYCGAHPPDVLLEIDHVIPKAAGGSDDPENLVTACWDCNRGKGDRLLDEGGHPTVSAKTVAQMEERLEQAKAYVELLNQLSNVASVMVDRVTEEWARAFGATIVERPDGAVYNLSGGGSWPKEATIRQFLRELDLEEILGAIDTSASRVGDTRGNDRYFYAICWRIIRERRSAGQRAPADIIRIEDLEVQIQDARVAYSAKLDRIDELEQENADLRLTVRRFREEAGRE
jgi:hypothetical protein